MAKKNKVAQAKAFHMTGAECAAFIQQNWKRIASRLHGKREDVEDAISEITCKCLQVENGYGTLLKWNDDPFAVARTEEDWLSFLVWQSRARLGVIRAKNGYWFDQDIIQPFKTEDDADDLHHADRASFETADEDGDRLAATDELKLMRVRRIVQYIIFEEERLASNYRPRPGASYDAEILSKAAYRVLDDLAKGEPSAERNVLIWEAKVMDERSRYEVADAFDVTPNNLDQIVHKIKDKLSKFGPALLRKHIRRLFIEAD